VVSGGRAVAAIEIQLATTPLHVRGPYGARTHVNVHHVTWWSHGSMRPICKRTANALRTLSSACCAIDARWRHGRDETATRRAVAVSRLHSRGCVPVTSVS
jgi:hypothetical protein